MTAKLIKSLLLASVILLFATTVLAQNSNFRSQTSTWTTASKNNYQLGFRYLPELSYSSKFSHQYEFSAEAAGNATWFSNYKNLDHKKDQGNVEPYRLWLRLSAPQHEFRVGLQKINFGSATLFRPLRWFDSVDPRDPLKLSEGVYGLLGRYYYLNNANIWLWALLGNDDRKGWEALASNKRRTEFGGRLQMPVPRGEMGFSFHQRRVSVDGKQVGSFYPTQGTFTEQIFGLDGKWDVGVGLWLEATVAKQPYRNANARYRSLVTVGSDYTFDVGEGGLHVLFEEFMSLEARRIFSNGETQFMSGISVAYPLNLLDNISTVIYYDQEQDEWSRFLTWQRTLDKWQINIRAFWNPEAKSQLQNSADFDSLAGSGLQIMLVYNN